MPTVLSMWTLSEFQSIYTIYDIRYTIYAIRRLVYKMNSMLFLSAPPSCHESLLIILACFIVTRPRSLSNYRSKLALAAAFVDATDSRYGFSSNDLRSLGGSELSRIEDCIQSDHGKSLGSSRTIHRA